MEAFGAGAAPFVCSAPGRVNLLGEHIDYNGLPVLPMTLNRETVAVARAASGNTVRLRNMNAAFPGEEFENISPLPQSIAGGWVNYCKAAIEGINQEIGIEHGPGMDVLVGGDLPTAAGMSSSSALVVTIALAYLRILDRPVEGSAQRVALATLLAQAERYVGVHGGGMDQAIILLGERGHACKIDFFPLRVERVPLFSTHTFVVCDSLVVADKSGAALHRYNAGPASCKLIRALVERHAQITFGDEVELERLGDLWFGPLCLTHGEVQALFREAFPRPRTTLAELSSILDLDESEIRRRWIRDLPEPEGGFPLQALARHQITEYMRVEQGRDCLLAGDAEGFGGLMNDSHQSCAQDYGVSSAELDALVRIGRSAGSSGSRLTGAGFGGATVHLVEKDGVGKFISVLNREYYEDLAGHRGVDAVKRGWIIIAEPRDAAGYEHL